MARVSNLQGAGPGRPKGCPNKFTALRESFLQAFDKTGGTEGLVEWAKKNPSEFYRMICHLLPRTVENTGSDGGPLVIRINSNVGQ
jgi:hypothetical protein